MASELKPWKYEIKYGPEGEDAYSWVYDDHGAMVATMKTHKAKQIVDTMNTRPAPAATVTGLETVGYGNRGLIGLLAEGVVTHASLCWTQSNEFSEPVCLRSQAEELLAAEQEKALFFKTAMEIAQTHCGLKDKTIDKLEADNAAKEERIKAETELREDHQKRNKELEAKLVAATETAAQAAYRACAETRHVTLGEKAAAAVRAAMGGKPS